MKAPEPSYSLFSTPQAMVETEGAVEEAEEASVEEVEEASAEEVEEASAEEAHQEVSVEEEEDSAEAEEEAVMETTKKEATAEVEAEDSVEAEEEDSAEVVEEALEEAEEEDLAEVEEGVISITTRRHGFAHRTQVVSAGYICDGNLVYSARRVPASTLALMAAEQDVDQVNAHVPNFHHRRPGSKCSYPSSPWPTKMGREQT